MVWSYSRINAFDDCPYAWFLNYIKHLPKISNFFAQYGTFMHDILRRYLSGELQKYDLIPFYIGGFADAVTEPPKTVNMRTNYFRQGIDYLKTLSWDKSKVLAVETKVEYTLAGFPAMGFIDLLEKPNGIILTDHKSAALKGYSGRKKPTKDDIALDEYFRQLYIYSIPVHDIYGEYPDTLRLNCFRNQTMISVPFDRKKLDSTVEWAESQITKIITNEDWKPRMDYFRCNYLCDMRYNCEYYLINKGR